MTTEQKKAVYRVLRAVLRILLDAVDFSDIDELCLMLTESIAEKLRTPEDEITPPMSSDLPF